MQNALAIVLIAVVFVHAPVVAAQAAPPASRVMGEFVRSLAPGTYVKLRLKDRTKVTGMLVAIEDDAVTVKPRTRIPEPARRVKVDEISDADLVRGSAVGKTIGIAAAVGAGAAIGMLYILVALYAGD